MGERGKFEKCKGRGSKVRRKNECRSKIAREVGHSRRKKLEEGEITRKIHGKDIIWMG